jgi:hypothetical protein
MCVGNSHFWDGLYGKDVPGTGRRHAASARKADRKGIHGEADRNAGYYQGGQEPLPGRSSGKDPMLCILRIIEKGAGIGKLPLPIACLLA